MRCRFIAGDPGECLRAARDAEEAHERVVAGRRRVVAVSGEVGVGSAVWRGVAADAFGGRMTDHGGSAARLAAWLAPLGDVLRQFANDLTAAQQSAWDAEATARGAGLDFTDAGELFEPFHAPMSSAGVGGPLAEHDLTVGAAARARMMAALEQAEAAYARLRSHLAEVPSDVLGASVGAAVVAGSSYLDMESPAVVSVYAPGGGLKVAVQRMEGAARVSVAVAYAGIGGTWQYEQFADGRVEVTLLASAAAGLAAKGLDTSAMYGEGSVWVVTGPGAMARAKALVADMYEYDEDYDKRQVWLFGPPPVVRVGRAPDKTVEVESRRGDGSRSFGGAGAAVGALVRERSVTDNSNGTLTEVFESSRSVSLIGAWSGFGVSGQGTATEQVSIARDSRGAVTQVQVVRSIENAMGGAGSAAMAGPKRADAMGVWMHVEGVTRTVETTAVLDVDSMHEQRVVEDYLTNHVAGSSVDQQSALADLLHERGQVSRVVYDGVVEGEGIDLSAGKGARSHGVSATGTETNTQAVEVSYLGAPDDTGQRSWVEMDEWRNQQ